MRLAKKPHLISSLFILTFLFVSCSFSANLDTAQITISLPENTRSANTPGNIKYYCLSLVNVPVKFKEILEYTMNDSAPDIDFDENLYLEFESFFNEIDENNKFDTTMYKINDTIRKNLTPGFWYIKLDVLDSNEKELYSGYTTVTLSAGQNENVKIRMFSNNRNSNILKKETLVTSISEYLIFQKRNIPDGISIAYIESYNKETNSFERNNAYTEESLANRYQNRKNESETSNYNNFTQGFETPETIYYYHYYALYPYIEDNSINYYTSDSSKSEDLLNFEYKNTLRIHFTDETTLNVNIYSIKSS